MWIVVFNWWRKGFLSAVGVDKCGVFYGGCGKNCSLDREGVFTGLL